MKQTIQSQIWMVFFVEIFMKSNTKTEHTDSKLWYNEFRLN